MNYFKIKQTIGKANRKAQVIGEVEKWHAHKKGILHRAFSVALVYKNKYVLQHRKHIAFDGVYDLTSSSHQLMQNGKLQDTIESIYLTLEREWELKKKDFVSKPNYEGNVYYKAQDEKSEFTEHEMCDIYTVKIRRLPLPNFDFAYGFSLVTDEELTNKNSRIYSLLAPWIKVAIEKKLI